MSQQQILGRVAGIFRYPVKSMAGEELERAHVKFTGIAGDRRFAFVRAHGRKSVQLDFPWFTGREYPPLVTYAAVYREGTSTVTVTTPAGVAYVIDSDDLQAELERGSGKSVSLLRLGRGTYDGAPLSLLSTRTMADVTRAASVADANPRRFRPNLLIALDGESHEDEWVGRALVVGEGGVKIWVTRRDPRCMMINLDPRTGMQNPAVLKHVANQRDGTLGVYATVLTEGDIATGDAICLLNSD